MTTKETWILIKTAFNAWSDDHVQSMGAALAYYTMFSIAPVLLIVIAIAGLAFGEEAARGEIAGQFQTLIGEQGALAMQALVESVNQPTKGLTATLIGGGLLLIGATTVFGELQSSLDRIWRVPGRDRSKWPVGLDSLAPAVVRHDPGHWLCPYGVAGLERWACGSRKMVVAAV